MNGSRMSRGEPRPVRVALAALLRDDAVYLQLRDEPGGPLNGLWEFPGGKIGPDESGSAAAEREFLEETGGRIACGEMIAENGFALLHMRGLEVQFVINEDAPFGISIFTDLLTCCKKSVLLIKVG